LEFHPRYSFEKGVAETARWYQEQGLIGSPNGNGHHSHAREKYEVWRAIEEGNAPQAKHTVLSAKIEQFDSFWEGPADVEKGYESFAQFYRVNYMPYVPKDRGVKILCISCGPGYFVNLLKQEGYTDVLGIDSDPEKVVHVAKRNLNCIAVHAVDFLEGAREPYDVIICEQELNHLTKEEMVMFLRLCWRKMRPGGTLIVHGLNGANPLTGSDASAQNFDHFNTFTEYSLRQVLEYTGFERVRILPLNLYVFYNNPLNYVGLAIMEALSLFFRLAFMLYGKKNKNFTKKIGAACVRSAK
jgi:2-polyprenyl-3-methyl-5-hydroxy-6-metoxy-1,4-benzoquinol methylase